MKRTKDRNMMNVASLCNSGFFFPIFPYCNFTDVFVFLHMVKTFNQKKEGRKETEIRKLQHCILLDGFKVDLLFQRSWQLTEVVFIAVPQVCPEPLHRFEGTIFHSRVTRT